LLIGLEFVYGVRDLWEFVGNLDYVEERPYQSVHVLDRLQWHPSEHDRVTVVVIVVTPSPKLLSPQHRVILPSTSTNILNCQIHANTTNTIFRNEQ